MSATTQNPVTPLVENGQYGPTITLNPGSKWPFRFGPSKAKLIVDNIDAIRAFLENHPPQERPPRRGNRSTND